MYIRTEQLMKEDEAGTSHHPAQSLRGKKKAYYTVPFLVAEVVPLTFIPLICFFHQCVYT